MSDQNVTSKSNTAEASYSIRQAARLLDKSEYYIGKCVRDGKIEAEKVVVGKGEKWMISESALEAFQARPRGTSVDGRRRCIGYFTFDEIERYAEEHPEWNLHLQNPGKSADEDAEAENELETETA